ncbi:MAG: glutathionylspermidine synthase family protein [Chloroflexi bacterium]|nr:glutathionylspermidine synthase family protein [Chloroflexota bacterium]
MRTLAEVVASWGYARYDAAWLQVERAGRRSLALDTRWHGRRYPSLNALLLSAPEAESLVELTRAFARLLPCAVDGLLEDPEWWPRLAWPRAAIELARQEPRSSHGAATHYGRFDWLLDTGSTPASWQLVECNADTPSGGREVSGLEPAILRLHGGGARGTRPLSRGLAGRLASVLVAEVSAFRRSRRPGTACVGVVSSHSWLEDMAQAYWLGSLLRARGLPTLVGDVRDLAVVDRRVLLRGQPIDALYRFYPVEAWYRHGSFAPVLDAVLDGRLLLLNGLRGFLAQSKAALAWLWQHRTELGPARALVEAHLPAIVPATEAEQSPMVVIKHVNGREGDAVAFGADVDAAGWERRLLDGGYVVQRRVFPQSVEDVEVDEIGERLTVARPRYACVGSFLVGYDYGGCYTRLGGAITTAHATFVPTWTER